MPPPVSFITIGAIPFTQLVTQAMFNVANEQWFKYVATVPIVLGIQTTQGGTFVPRVGVYESDGTTQVGVDTDGIKGHWHALLTAADYYVKVIHTGATSTDSDFTFTADTRPLDVISIATGDIIVNDDADNFPAAVLDNTGAVKFFVSAIPGGETGAILPSNVSFWHDFYEPGVVNKIKIFDADLELITSVTCGLTGSNKPRFGTDITNDRVYVINQSRQLWTISSAGIAANTGYTFPVAPAVFPDVIAVNEDGTKLYWATVYGKTGIIHALNLSTFTVLPDLHTISGFIDTDDQIAKTLFDHPGDIFVMPNGNLVTWWFEEATFDYHLIVVSSAGTLLYSYDYVYPISIDHLAYIDGDSDHILIWLFNNGSGNIAHFGRLTLATGIIDQDFTINTFSEGENETGIEKFGPSSSCTFVRFQLPVTPTTPDSSGIYYINPTKTTGGGTGKHDSYYDHSVTPTGSIERKIPDPTIRTGLFGE